MAAIGSTGEMCFPAAASFLHLFNFYSKLAIENTTLSQGIKLKNSTFNEIRPLIADNYL